MAIDMNRDLAVTSSVLLLVLLWHTEAVPSGIKTDLSNITELETATPFRRSSNCSLRSVDLDIIELDSKIKSGYPLIEIELRILNYSADFLKQRLKGFFQPNYWVRSQGQTGISLLVWEDTIWNLFKPYYKIGVDYITVELTDFPQGCLRSLSAENTALVIRELLLNDFKIEKDNSEGVQNTDVQVCNQIVKETDQSVMFVYHCCEKHINGDVICEEAKANNWLDIITDLQIPILIVLYLYGPAFLIYFFDFIPATRLYLREISEPALRPIRFLYTNDPRTVRGNYQTACNTDVKGEERFQRLTAQIRQIRGDAVYKGISNRAQLIVTSQRLLTQNEVPVGMFRVVYNLFTCRCRHVQVFEGNEREGHYCDHPCTERCNIKLYECMQLLSKAFILLILSVPLIIMTVNFYRDKALFEEKDKIVKEMNSTVATQTELSFFIANVTFLGPFYLFYLADMLSFGSAWKCVRPAFRNTFQQYRYKISTPVMSWIRKKLRYLFEIPCWCLWYVPIFCIITIVTIVISGIKVIPFIHLMSQAFQNLKSSWLKRCLVMPTLMSVYYVFVIWAFFIVYLFFYTIIGIIIYAESTMKILTAIIFLLIYGRTTFNKVWQDYMEYHSRVFEKLIKTAKSQSEEFRLNRQSRRGAIPTSGQENIQEEVTATLEEEEPTGFILPFKSLTTRPISRKGEAMLHINSMFLVVDKHGQYFMPVEFFFQAIKIDSCLSPGPVHTRYFDAIISYIKIIIFLAIVFIAVMAFGDTYKLSLTSELLATVAVSLVPLILNVIKSDNTTAKQYDEDFEEKLSAKFDEYEEDFPISDFVCSRLGEVPEQNLGAETNVNVSSRLGEVPEQNLGAETNVNVSSRLEEIPEQNLGAETNADVDLIIIKTAQSQQNPNWDDAGDNEGAPLIRSQRVYYV